MRALITGVTGQDGSYMAEILLRKGYEVHGLARRASTENTFRIAHLLGKVRLHYGDLQDGNSIERIVKEVRPTEIYNFAAMSQVRTSYDMPAYTGDVTGVGFARILETVRNLDSSIKIYQASSSEMFGKVQEVPQTETTPFYPRSPYGCAKAYSFYLGRSFREGYGLKVYNGILFNHESPRRGGCFLSQKVVHAAVRIHAGQQDKLKLGNLEARRDWGYAREYCEWIWRIMQYPEPTDFLIATGENHSVEEFVAEAFRCMGMDWREYVVQDPDLMRPAEVDELLGDASKARRLLGFDPKVRFKELVRLMVDYELDAFAHPHGYPADADRMGSELAVSVG